MNCFEDTIIVIDGNTYNITPIPAMKGLSYLRRLGKLLGAPLATMMNDNGGADKVDGEGSLQKAVQILVDNMDKEDVETLITDLLKTVTKQGQPLNFTIEFTKNYGKLFKLVKEVVEVNFGSLFTLSAIDV